MINSFLQFLLKGGERSRAFKVLLKSFLIESPLSITEFSKRGKCAFIKFSQISTERYDPLISTDT